MLWCLTFVPGMLGLQTQSQLCIWPNSTHKIWPKINLSHWFQVKFGSCVVLRDLPEQIVIQEVCKTTFGTEAFELLFFLWLPYKWLSLHFSRVTIVEYFSIYHSYLLKQIIICFHGYYTNTRKLPYSKDCLGRLKEIKQSTSKVAI